MYDGFICDNGGICASNLKCPDGSPKKKYYFVSAEGVRGQSIAVCPGDPDDPEPTLVPPTADQIFQAFTKVVPTKSAISVQPPGGKTLVNFETILSTVAEPFSSGKIDLVPGFVVELQVTPRRFHWTFGDGEYLDTDGPGRPWQKGDDVATLITHVYTDTDPVEATVTTTWGATVSINGSAPVPVDGTVDVTSPSADLEILEATPTLVE